MTTAATEVKPQPYLIDCSVRNDPVTARTLVVKPVESSGYSGLAWHEAWRAQLLAVSGATRSLSQRFSLARSC